MVSLYRVHPGNDGYWPEKVLSQLDKNHGMMAAVKTMHQERMANIRHACCWVTFPMNEATPGHE